MVAYLPEQVAAGARFVEGRPSAEDLRGGDQLEIVAAACRRLHGGAVPRRFDMFAIQRRYLALVQERGFRLPPRYLELEPKVARSSGPWPCRPSALPCNNDLLAENLIDPATRSG